MKLPRWLVIAMLTTSVLSVLAAAGWWWVTWPERTFIEFRSSGDADRFDDQARLLGDRLRSVLDSNAEGAGKAWDVRNPKPVPRNLMDLVSSRQEFECEGRDAMYRLRVERGRVVDVGFYSGDEWNSIIDFMRQ